jgi:hypothetical protein
LTVHSLLRRKYIAVSTKKPTFESFYRLEKCIVKEIVPGSGSSIDLLERKEAAALQAVYYLQSSLLARRIMQPKHLPSKAPSSRGSITKVKY